MNLPILELIEGEVVLQLGLSLVGLVGLSVRIYSVTVEVTEVPSSPSLTTVIISLSANSFPE